MKPRARAFEVVVLIALVAALAFFVRPEPEPPPVTSAGGDTDLNLRVKGVAFGALCLAFPPAIAVAPLALQPSLDDLGPKPGESVSLLTIDQGGTRLEDHEGEPVVVAGQTMEEVKKAMGEPNFSDVETLIYHDEDAVATIHFHNGVVDQILLSKTTPLE